MDWTGWTDPSWKAHGSEAKGGKRIWGRMVPSHDQNCPKKFEQQKQHEPKEAGKPNWQMRPLLARMSLIKFCSLCLVQQQDRLGFKGEKIMKNIQMSKIGVLRLITEKNLFEHKI